MASTPLPKNAEFAPNCDNCEVKRRNEDTGSEAHTAVKNKFYNTRNVSKNSCK